MTNPENAVKPEDLSSTRPDLPAPLNNSIALNQADVLIDDCRGLLLYDHKAGIFLAAPETKDDALHFLSVIQDAQSLQERKRRYFENREVLCCWMNAKTAGFLKNRGDVEVFGECAAFFLPENSPLPERNSALTFRTALPEDFDFVRSRYDLSGDGELKSVLNSRDLFFGLDSSNRIVGFAGMHPEGGMGLLEVFPGFRRKGYALDLETELMKRMRKRNLIPCCDVFLDNASSLALQKKAGLQRAKTNVLWMRIGQTEDKSAGAPQNGENPKT